MSDELLLLLRELRDETLEIIESEWDAKRPLGGSFEKLEAICVRVDAALDASWPEPKALPADYWETAE